MRADEHEHERFISRLATLKGFEILPSVGRWVLIRVEDRDSFAKRLGDKLAPGAISVPEHLPGTVRLPVRDAKSNEAVVHAMSQLLGEIQTELELEEESEVESSRRR
jgi:histidinol-phosphate/aromatic aminotransferase/cobyric acid decarboxylase-like protein